MPAHRDRGSTVATEEIPVGSRVDLLREVADFALGRIGAVIILARKKDPHHEDGRVHAGQLDIPMPEAGLHVEEVVEEALVASSARAFRPLRRVPEEAQRRQRQVARFCTGAPSTLDTDRVRRKCKSNRRDAGERGCWPAIGDQPVLPVHRIPEESERPLLDVLVESGKSASGRGVGDGRARRKHSSSDQQR